MPIKSPHARVVQMEQDMVNNAEATARNTDSIETIRQNTQDIVDSFAAQAGGFMVWQGLGRLARPIEYIATAMAAVKGIWK